MKAFRAPVQSAHNGDTTSEIDTQTRQARPYSSAMGHSLGDLTSMLNKETDPPHEVDIRSFQLTRIALLGVLAVGGTVAGFSVWWQLRSIERTLSGIQGTLGKVSQSLDLTRRIAVTSQDEIEHTASALNELLTRVAKVVGAVRLSSDLVAIGSREIAIGNSDLSARTKEQAGSIDETAASMTHADGNGKAERGQCPPSERTGDQRDQYCRRRYAEKMCLHSVFRAARQDD